MNDAMMTEFRRCQELVEQRLGEFFGETAKYAPLLESMRYSLLGGGKRVRATLCLKFCEASGGGIDTALDAACAVEMLHAYSLIHDDLPCMDDDDTRRGKPSNHIKYGECVAVLAGDALQAAAFETLLLSNLPSERVVAMGRVLAGASGPHGICGGQYLDLFHGDVTGDELTEIHTLKTAALLSASARLGVIAAGGTPEQIAAAGRYATALGLAFQAQDDILDHIDDVDECLRVVHVETEKAIAAIDEKFGNTDFLIWLAQMLKKRKY